MLSTQAKSLARLDRANDTPRLAEPLSVEAHRAASTAAKTLARLDRANDFPIWRAEPLKAEALLLRGEDVRALRPRERHDLLFRLKRSVKGALTELEMRYAISSSVKAQSHYN